MNQEGVVLLRQLIKVTAGMDVLVQSGDCRSIGLMVNAWLVGAEVSTADVYAAIKDRADFGGPKMNVDLLRTRIDAMPALYSARLNSGLSGEPGTGALQAILNEVVIDLPEVTIADVMAAMQLRKVQSPTMTSSGTVAMVGIARL